MSELAEFYAGRSIFITGATGFMGKVGLSSYMHAASMITSIFILIFTD